MGLPEDDQPPEQLWLNSEAISEHFKAVRERYRDRTGTGGTGGSEDFQQNEFTKGLR